MSCASEAVRILGVCYQPGGLRFVGVRRLDGLVRSHLKLPELAIPRHAVNPLGPGEVALAHLDRDPETEQRFRLVAHVDQGSDAAAIHDELGHHHGAGFGLDPEAAGRGEVAPFVRSDDGASTRFFELDHPHFRRGAEAGRPAARRVVAGEVRRSFDRRA